MAGRSGHRGGKIEPPETTEKHDSAVIRPRSILAEILRMKNLFSVGGVGVTPRLDVQGGASGGSDRVEEGGDVNWRSMGVDARPSVGVNIPGLGDLNAQFRAGWNGFRADLPKSIQNLGAPEHVQGGTRGPLAAVSGVLVKTRIHLQ